MKETGVFIILLLGLALVCSPTYAASGDTSDRPEKLAVLDLEANYGVEGGFAKAYSVVIRDEIHSYGEYEVMSTEDLRAVMSREAMLQAMGCDDDGAACLVSFGRAIGTRFMVAGSLAKLGSTYNISLRILDTKGENAGVVKRASGSCKCSEDELIAAVQKTAAKLMGKETPEMQRTREAAEKEELAAKKRKAAEVEKQRLLAQEEEKRKAEKADRQARITKGLKKGDTFTDPTTGMEFVYVKGGCYQMGCDPVSPVIRDLDTPVSPVPSYLTPIPLYSTPRSLVTRYSAKSDEDKGCSEDEQPIHEVCVDGFYLGKYEVTQEEYQKINGSNPSHFKKGSNYPVEQVSWNDARSFISKLSSRSGKDFRLPTEAEWEYAARSGGKKEKYSGSNSLDSVAWYVSNSGKSTHRVGTKSPNGLGLYDMSGNVWEWCSDWFGENYYSSSPRINPQGALSGSDRVFRGGSWSNYPRYLRSAERYRGRPDYRILLLGFRLVFPEGS